MALDKTVSPRLAIGVGCRRDCPAGAIEAVVKQACLGLQLAGAAFFTLEAKRDEPGLLQAAATFGLPITFLSLDAMQPGLAGAVTRSGRVEAAVGIASVAEAAALAGAGPGARLLVPRIAQSGATCAVAAMDADP